MTCCLMAARDAVDRTVQTLKEDGTLASLTVTDKYVLGVFLWARAEYSHCATLYMNILLVHNV